MTTAGSGAPAMDGATRRVLERVRKLLALAGSADEHEAASAAAMAQRLMAEHALSEAHVAASADEEAAGGPVGEHPEPLFGGVSQAPAWKYRLAGALAGVNGCIAVRLWNRADDRGGSVRVVLVGRPGDAAACAYLFAYCVRAVDALAARHRGRGAAWLRSYRAGVVDTIVARLHEAQSRARAEHRAAHPGPDGERAIVLLDARVARAQREADRLTGGHEYKVRPAPEDNARDMGRYDGHTIELGAAAGGALAAPVPRVAAPRTTTGGAETWRNDGDD